MTAGTGSEAASTPSAASPPPAAGGEGGAGVGLGGRSSTSEMDDFSTHAVCLQVFQRNQQLVRKVQDMSCLVG